jgi:anti-sigma B factor antagonist
MADFFSVRKNGGTIIAEIVKQEITMYEIDKVKEEFTGILESGSGNIVLNFKNLDFISSIVLAGMVYLLKLTKDKGGNLIFCELKPKIKEVFKITSLDKVFEIYTDETAALAAFNGKKP